MVNDFLAILMGIIYLFANRLSNISINIQNINTITDIYFLIMCTFKRPQFLSCWFGINHRINAL